MINAVIIGAGGRMGQALIRCCARGGDVRLAGTVEAPGCSALGRDAGAVAGVAEIGVRVVSDLRAAAAAADVLVDFSSPAALPETVRVAVSLKKPLVIGTTGLTDADTSAVRDASKTIPIVLSPNMSAGVNVLFSMVKKAASVLGMDYDVEIVEAHHRFKKDAPSGTALRLGERIAEGRGQDFRKAAVFGRAGATGERPRGQIGLHAVRAGDLVGEHSVTFATEGERLEFVHKAGSREAFATGALRAAAWICGRKPGLYDMQDVLGL